LGFTPLVNANLGATRLDKSILAEANLSEANLSLAHLIGANFSGANLRGANLKSSILVNTNFEKADLSGCAIYGIAAWDVNTEGANQTNLIITRGQDPIITVDSLEVAQFIYLLLDNVRLRNVIDVITTKVVLILGRFKPERKAIFGCSQRRVPPS
jgi:uncharacterized protein YjbI with pentapeptide repeats